MELSEAAHILGVHYQTAYRWVRDGSLRAHKVRSRYQIEAAALEQFQSCRSAPLPPPQATRVRNWNALSSRFYVHLAMGTEASARDQVSRLVNGGVEVADVIDELISPALVQIGQQWRVGAISVAVEHRAVRICERILDSISVAGRGRPRGKVIVTTAVGDQHELPSAMAAAALRSSHWLVQHLGSQVPFGDLVSLAAIEEPDFIVISVTNPWAIQTANEMREGLEQKGFPTLVGGPGRGLSSLFELLEESKYPLGRRHGGDA